MEKHIEYFKVEVDDVSVNHEMKINVLQKKIQNVSDNHGSILGFGFDDMSNIGLFWVVTRLTVEILRLPILNESFRIETWLETPGRVGINRYYKLFVENELIVYGVAKWALVNRNTLTVERLDQFDFMNEIDYLDEVLSFRLPVLKKLQRRNTEDQHLTIRLCATKEMLDHNNHVNNTEYIKMALEEFNDLRKIRMYQISYGVAIYEGQTIEMTRYSEDSETYVEGYVIDAFGSRNLSFQVRIL
ncbi:MAG: hypothetical protein KKE16_04000 [Firmicutes bacterium]|nr:hypothetical protein [Bacillota bacterium]